MIRRMVRLTALLLVAFGLFAAPPAQPKNVILLIADGMGPAHHTALKHYRGADCNICRMPVVGLTSTHCLNRAVTDSAAAASAWATGRKVNYEVVSVDAEGKPLQTVLEIAELRGKATGLVTTARFYDATPAAFAAHADHRDESAKIIGQMLRSGAELIIGTGLQTLTSPELSHVLGDARQQGYTVATTRPELDAAAGASRLFAVFPQQTRDVDVPEARLPDLTRIAIDRLRTDPDGFFLMVEHEGTDSSSHQNNIADLRASLTSFDQAVGIALEFAATSGNTLVLVTSDHETGGLRITETKTARFRLEWSSTDHTGVSVPVFGFGVGAAEFAGVYDNADGGRRVAGVVGK